MKVSTILSTKRQRLITIGPGETLQEAAVLLSEHNIGALIVVNDNGALIGILSERDIVRQLSRSKNVSTALVGDVMTAEIITGLPGDDLISVAHTMTERRFRHLPIVKDEQLIGMISIGDVMKAQRDSYRGERNTLETQILAE